MTESKLSLYMQQEFNQLNRNMTYVTVLVVCVLAIAAWWFGIEVKGKTASVVGIIFIVLAAFTFKIPFFTYRHMLRKYKNEPDKLTALGPNLREFQDNILRRK